VLKYVTRRCNSRVSLAKILTVLFTTSKSEVVNRIDIVCGENTRLRKMAILQGNFGGMADRLRAKKIESEEADIDQTEFQLHSARKEQTLLA
jgi:hypothetical protein